MQTTKANVIRIIAFILILAGLYFHQNGFPSFGPSNENTIESFYVLCEQIEAGIATESDIHRITKAMSEIGREDIMNHEFTAIQDRLLARIINKPSKLKMR